MISLKQEADNHDKEMKDAKREKERMTANKSSHERDLRNTRTALNNQLGEEKEAGEKWGEDMRIL